jgi:hypothetical protein
MDCPRVLIKIWGPTDQLSQFIDTLVAHGWDAHAPNCTEEGVPDVLDPYFRIMTSAGVIAVGEAVRRLPSPLKDTDGNVATEANGNVVSELSNIPYFARTLEEWLTGDTLKGDQPRADDAVAAIIAGSYVTPFDWARLVIDKYYDAGLRFRFVCYEPDEEGSDYWCEFYSASAEEAEFKMEGSLHCCGVMDWSDPWWCVDHPVVKCWP